MQACSHTARRPTRTGATQRMECNWLGQGKVEVSVVWTLLVEGDARRIQMREKKRIEIRSECE